MRGRGYRGRFSPTQINPRWAPLPRHLGRTRTPRCVSRTPLGLIPESRHRGAHRALRLGGCLSEWTGRVPILNWLHWPGGPSSRRPSLPEADTKRGQVSPRARESRSPWQLPGSPSGLQRAPQPGPAPLGTAAGRHGDRGPTPPSLNAAPGGDRDLQGSCRSTTADTLSQPART